MDHHDAGEDPAEAELTQAVLDAFDAAPVSAFFPGIGDIAATSSMSPADLIRLAANPATLTTDLGVDANIQFATDLWKIIETMRSIPEDNTPTLLAAIAEEHFVGYARDHVGIRRIFTASAAAMAADRPESDPDAAVENGLRDAFLAATTQSYADMTVMFATLYENLLDVWGRKPRVPIDYPQIAIVFTALYEGLLLRYMCDDNLDLEAAKRLARFGIHAFMIAATADLDDDRSVERIYLDLLGTPRREAVDAISSDPPSEDDS